MKNLSLVISLGCLVIVAAYSCGRRPAPKPIVIASDTTRKATHTELSIDSGSLHVTDVPPGTDSTVDLWPAHPLTKEDSIRMAKIHVYDTQPDSLYFSRMKASGRKYHWK